MFEDKTLKCKECGADFIFTAGEQEFYAEKGFRNEPVRCKDCRSSRKTTRSNDREMFDAVCAEHFPDAPDWADRLPEWSEQ